MRSSPRGRAPPGGLGRAGWLHSVILSGAGRRTEFHGPGSCVCAGPRGGAPGPRGATSRRIGVHRLRRPCGSASLSCARAARSRGLHPRLPRPAPLGDSHSLLPFSGAASRPWHQLAAAVRARVAHLGRTRGAEGAFEAADSRVAIGGEGRSASLALGSHLQRHGANDTPDRRPASAIPARPVESLRPSLARRTLDVGGRSGHCETKYQQNLSFLEAGPCHPTPEPRRRQRAPRAPEGGPPGASSHPRRARDARDPLISTPGVSRQPRRAAR